MTILSLVYFDDIDKGPIMFKHDKEIDFEEVKNFLTKKTKILEG